MSEPRDDYLPAFSFLQQAADATLIARNQYSYVLLACAIVGLVSVTLLVPKSGIVESLEQFVVPACSLAALAAFFRKPRGRTIATSSNLSPFHSSGSASSLSRLLSSFNLNRW